MSKWIRVSQLSMPVQHTRQELFLKAEKKARVRTADVEEIRISKQSVDARKKDAIKYSYAVELRLKDRAKWNHSDSNVREFTPVVYAPAAEASLPESEGRSGHPAVIGAGPAGLFAAYLLALHGFCPAVYERGKCVSERQIDVERFWETGVLDPESNVQFGEGGAGTFSDGKLNTLVHDRLGRNRFVLETFVRFGAPEEILYAAKPHIGTDILRTVVTNLRQEIERLGGRFYFSSRVTNFRLEHGAVSGLEINGDRRVDCDAAILAIGHSARDTFELLRGREVPMTVKPFAVGFRVEHPQEMINRSQYGENADFAHLPTAPYKLTHQTADGRGVYSFCMCPGGYIVNASSEDGRTAVNGMSFSDRGSANANSAVVVTVTPEDFPTGDVLGGLALQRELEERAAQIGGGQIPQQLLGDFERNQISATYGDFESCAKGKASLTNLRSLLPEALSEAFLEGMHAFGRKIRGFDREDCILSGVESRTSSPVRILRDETLQSEIRGLYPCGEGAGYAGGIMSAAMDGLKTAEAYIAGADAKASVREPGTIPDER